MQYDVKNIKLAQAGKKKIEWAEQFMGVLNIVKKDFNKTKPLKGIKVAACLHVTAETANLMRTLKAGGADIRLCASNPLSTQDDVAAALVKEYKIPTFAIKGESNSVYYNHLNAVLDFKPNVTMDDGADLVTLVHTKRKDLVKNLIGGTEETTTGVNRLKIMEKGVLQHPVIAVNEAKTKHLFDNRYGTGQSTLDGIMRATNVLLSGLKVVVAGYGWCGKGVALRASGLGAKVIVTEIDPIRALEALMDGFEVMPMSEAAAEGDLFITVTGAKHVISVPDFRRMKSGSIVCNAGHFDVELDIAGLKKIAIKVSDERPQVKKYFISKDKYIFVLADGRLVNLGAAEGHPAAVMDMSFANQALGAQFLVQHRKKLSNKVYPVPEEVDKRIAMLKLMSMNVKINRQSAVQRKYGQSWTEGT